MEERLNKPLCVDLDGTFIKSDLLFESLFCLLRNNPLFIFALPFWMLRGRAALKREIASQVDIDFERLPYNTEFIEYLKEEREKGRNLVLATASDEILARRLADRTGLFKTVLGSDGKTNLSGTNKLKRLEGLYGEKGFDYAGNAAVDIKIWKAADKSIIVGGSRLTAFRAGKTTDIFLEFRSQNNPLMVWLKAARVHQWVKNSLIFLPLILAHQILNIEALLNCLYSFLSFSFLASASYILNDLMDLEADRRHPDKCKRPFASGGIPPQQGIAGAAVLVVLSLVFAVFTPENFRLVLLIYALCTVGYSLFLKKLPLIDILLLAFLYTVRLIGGAAAGDVEISKWLLAFSMFIFLSLACVKRYAEILMMKDSERDKVPGRGYQKGDADLIAHLGSASGYISVLVMALYVNSEEVSVLYSRPWMLWLMCPALLYWISRVWMIAHRGGLHEDPVVYAIKDKTSYLVAFVCTAIILLAV